MYQHASTHTHIYVIVAYINQTFKHTVKNHSISILIHIICIVFYYGQNKQGLCCSPIL